MDKIVAIGLDEEFKILTKNNIQINMPSGAKKVLELLESKGFEGYAVGGCVRDSLLGKEPKDWDFTTNALPEQMKKIFHKTIDTGIEHGTITVRIGGESYEVTTYRVDGKYSDGRHPDEVKFTPNLKEDLLRRDFTINAMAYNLREGLVDLYGGVYDLNDKVIRCVGNPIERFSEDALRMLRAIRFSGVLGFEIENETLQAIEKLKENIRLVSKERIQVELVKLITSDYPNRIKIAEDTGLANEIIAEYCDCKAEDKDRILRSLCKAENDEVIRLAILFYKIDTNIEATTESIDLEVRKAVKKILKDLKFDNKTVDKVSLIVSARGFQITTDEIKIRKQMNALGKDLYMKHIKVVTWFIQENKRQLFEEQVRTSENIIKRKDPTSIKELDITGLDLINLGMKQGQELGEMLEMLLNKVIENPMLNKKEILCEFVNC